MYSTLENQNIFLAPMEDITDYPFRQVLLKVGRPDVFFTEFVNVNGLMSRGREKVVHRLHFNKEEKPIILQFWGRDPQQFKDAFEYSRDFDFDGVNINLGCPVKKVMKAGCGSALINEFDIVRDIVRSLENKDIPVSIKTRIGRDSFDEGWINFLLDLNLHSLFIHARTAKQVFSGSADWSSIERVVDLKNKKNFNTKIIGNGDITSIDEANVFQKKYGLDGIMIGREVFKNPWVFNSKKDISDLERLNTLLFHFNEMKNFLNIFPKKSWLSIKKFYFAYLREKEEFTCLRRELFKIDDLDQSVVFLEKEVKKLTKI